MSLINFGDNKEGIFNIKLDKSFFDSINKIPGGLKIFLCITICIGFFYFNFSNKIYRQEIKEIQTIENDIQETTKLIYDFNHINSDQLEFNEFILNEIRLNHEILLEIIYTNDKRFNLMLNFFNDVHGRDCSREYKQLKDQLDLTNEYYHKILNSYIERIKINDNKIKNNEQLN